MSELTEKEIKEGRKTFPLFMCGFHLMKEGKIWRQGSFAYDLGDGVLLAWIYDFMVGDPAFMFPIRVSDYITKDVGESIRIYPSMDIANAAHEDEMRKTSYFRQREDA